MRYIIIVFSLLIFFCNSSFASLEVNHLLDDYVKQFNNPGKNQTQNTVLKETVDKIRSQNIDENVISLIIDLTKNNKANKQAIPYYVLISQLYSKTDRFDKARDYIELANKLTKGTSQEAFTLNLLGILYLENSDFYNSYFSLKKAIIIGEQFKDHEALAMAYTNIGGIYYLWGNYERALMYFERGLNEYENFGNQAYLAVGYINIGEIYRLNGETDKAIELLQKGLKLSEKDNVTNRLITSHFNLSMCYLEKESISKALIHLKQACKLSEKTKNNDGLIMVYEGFGNYYVFIEKLDSALFFYNSSLNIAIEYNNLADIVNAYKGISNTYKKMGDVELAYENQILFKNYSDSLKEISQENNLSFVEEEYLNTLEKEKMLHQAEKEQKELQYKITLLTGIFLIILIIAAAVFIYISQKNRIKKNKLIRKNLELEKTIINNELTDFGIHIRKKNKILEHLKSELKRVKKSDLENKEEIINELLISLQIENQDVEEFELLQQNIDKVNKEFFYQLQKKYPDLTKNEKQLCAYIRIGLTIKEIAAINKVSEKAVKMGRYRLRKKLELKTEDSLGDFLNEI